MRSEIASTQVLTAPVHGVDWATGDWPGRSADLFSRTNHYVVALLTERRRRHENALRVRAAPRNRSGSSEADPKLVDDAAIEEAGGRDAM